MRDDRVIAIASRLYNTGWVLKREAREMSRDPDLYEEVRSRLAAVGLELVNRPYCPWYLCRLKPEYDDFRRHYPRESGLYYWDMALIVMLYAKLVLPQRLGEVPRGEQPSVTFEWLYNICAGRLQFGKKPATKQRLVDALRKLRKHHYILKSNEEFFPGPALYMLDRDDFLTEFAKFSIEHIYGNASQQGLAEAAATLESDSAIPADVEKEETIHAQDS